MGRRGLGMWIRGCGGSTERREGYMYSLVEVERLVASYSQVFEFGLCLYWYCSYEPIGVFRVLTSISVKNVSKDLS